MFRDLVIKIGEQKIELVYIPGGKFLMGQNANAAGIHSDECPQHEVSVDDFYMSKFPVTRCQFLSYKGSKCDDLTPITNVSWVDCVKCAKNLSTDELDVTLPTSAEWEYACRAGSRGDFCDGSLCGNDKYFSNSNLDKFGWFLGNSDDSLHKVGLKKPNSFGLYDMHGNVFEWCLDGPRVYVNFGIDNPIGDMESGEKCIRGGCYDSIANWCRCSYFEKEDKKVSSDFIGFRLVIKCKSFSF